MNLRHNPRNGPVSLTALHAAVSLPDERKAECSAITRLLLASGADTDARDSALGLAVRNDQVGAIKLLLEAGAEVNRVDPRDGEPPLFGACWPDSSKQTLKALISAGADVNGRSTWGSSALHEAVAHRCGEHHVAILLAAGASVNATDRAGMTALHIAADNGSSRTVKILLEYGADTNSTAKDGRTALDMARERLFGRGAKALTTAEKDAWAECIRLMGNASTLKAQ